MTRPTDASTARAFREVSEGKTFMIGAPISSFVESVLRRAAEFDAESPAGTDDTDQADPIAHRLSKPMHTIPEKVSTTKEPVYFSAQPTHVQCPKCPAHMPVGLHCGGPNCPLRK